jgi:hypothetical protein
MSGLFAPDDMAKWPKIDESNPDYQRDLASLQARGAGSKTGRAEHGGHTGAEHSGH